MASFGVEEKLKSYHYMLLIRRFEERSAQLYGMGLVGGFCHLYSGQEAVAVGSAMAVQEGDQIITAYRDHGHALACGVDPLEVMAELTGRVGGCSKGKGGSMHMFSRERNFFGGHGIVGAQVSVGTGLAFANRYRKNKSVCFVFFGDGATNQGQVYESFNMASLWKLPVVYVIENNRYGMGTSVGRASGNVELHERGLSFGIPGRVVDGMDVEAVFKEISEAASCARSGRGAVLLEMQTYRYRGHSMSDPGKYRDKGEVDRMREQNDPIDRLKAELLGSGVPEVEKKIRSIEDEVRSVVLRAVEFSKSSPEPEEKELWTDVYVN